MSDKKQNTNIFLIVIILILVAFLIPNNFVGKIVNDCSTGCLNNKVCLPIGTRLLDQYCDMNNNLESQKSEEAECNQNYECETNICLENKCKSYSTLKQSYCTIREELEYESYNECVSRL